jgi:hypothetical protein
MQAYHTSPRSSNSLAGSPQHGWPPGWYHEVNVGLLLTAGRCASRAEVWDGLKGKIHTCGQLTRSTYRHPPDGTFSCFFGFPRILLTLPHEHIFGPSVPCPQGLDGIRAFLLPKSGGGYSDPPLVRLS